MKRNSRWLVFIFPVLFLSVLLIQVSHAERNNAPTGLNKNQSAGDAHASLDSAPLTPLMAGGEDCATAPTFAGSFSDSDTTTGHIADMDPDPGATCPSLGGGTLVADSGEGPDLVYKLNTPVSGTAVANLNPTGSPAIQPAARLTCNSCGMRDRSVWV